MVRYDDDDQSGVEGGKITRWIPSLVVSIVLIGFLSLGWYAYRSGAQSINEEDLMVVEADSSPIKEKPLDPGGMKFPNQDKTIFDTFSGNAQVPPNVERVLPAPEEPIARDLDTSETKTWINDKLKDAPSADMPKPEVMEEKPAEIAAMKTQAPVTPPVAEVATPKAPEAKSDDIVTHVAKGTKPAEPVVLKKPTPAPKPQEGKKAASGKMKVQLGAYASEDEAKVAWEKIRKKFPELSDKPVYVVKADLGAKGTFHRLRAGGISDAKSLCAKLSGKGQACMVVP